MNERISRLLDDYRLWLLMKNFKARGVVETLRAAQYFFDYMEETGLEIAGIRYKQACDYREYMSSRKDERGRTRFSPSSINGNLSHTRLLFRYLTSLGLVSGNPFFEVERIREGERLPRNILSIEEMGKLLAGVPEKTAEDLLFKTALETLYATGMRISELENLSREDMDLTRGVILVRDDKERQDRLCALTECAQRLLARYVTGSNSQKPFLHGRPRSLNRFMNDGLSRLCRALKLPALTCHGIRHTIATHLLKKGADLREVQEFLGHRRIRNTEIYTRLSHEDLKKVIDELHPRERKER